MNVRKKFISYARNLAVTLAVFAVLMLLTESGVINRYYSGIMSNACINVILAVSLNLVTGLLGQLVLGHAGFMSVGAYAAALFTLNSGLPTAGAGGLLTLLLAIIVGGAAAAIIGFVIGIPALRLRGDYLAIITLGFGEIIRVIIMNVGFTGGAFGLNGIPSLTGFPVMFMLAALTIYIIYSYMLSRHGRAVLSIREDEIAAEASGINTTRYKMIAFVMAAFFAGLAGGLYAHNIGVIAPQNFDFNKSIEILVMVVLGGMGSITGATCAAILLTFLPELLRSVASAMSNAGLPGILTAFFENRMLLYSIVLILIMLFRPGGLLGRSEFSLAGFGRWVKRLITKKPAKDGGKEVG